MQQILEGLDGVQCLMDVVVIFGTTQEEYYQWVEAILQCLSATGMTLNVAKCEFSKSSIHYLGQIVSADGIQADPAKVEAITNMAPPTDVSSIQRFLGMANQLRKCIPSLAEMTKPLRDLLSAKNMWVWGPSQQTAFAKIKKILSSMPTLALYDLNNPMILSADTSSYWLGAVLKQQKDGTWRAVVYASRSQSATEQQYAQIEKEALATTWAAERFSDFLTGL